MFMGVVDTLMVGRVAPEAIGAVGLGSILYFSAAIFGMGLLLGLDTFVSQSYGAGNSPSAIAGCARRPSGRARDGALMAVPRGGRGDAGAGAPPMMRLTCRSSPS